MQPSTVDVDALFLSNSAEVLNGMAYVLGGGWTRCWPRAADAQTYPYERVLPITVFFRVPWGDTNTEHRFRVRIQDEDNSNLTAPVEGMFNAGRQAGLTLGMSQVVALSVRSRVTIPGPGIYHVVVDVNDSERKRIQFEAIQDPALSRSR